MTRLFLVAGVAALAIAAPASAKPGGNGGHGGGHAAVQSGGGGHASLRASGGGGAFRAQSHGGGAFRMSGGGGHAFQMRSAQRGGFSAQRQNRNAFAFQSRGHASARVDRNRGAQFRLAQHQERQAVRSNRLERQQLRIAERNQVRANRLEQVRGREAMRNQIRANRIEQIRGREAMRNQIRANRIEQIRGREAFRNDVRMNRIDLARNREAFRDELRANRIERRDNGMFVRDARLGGRTLRPDEFRNAGGFGIGGCPPGLASKGCMPPGQAAKLLGVRLSDAGRVASLRQVPYSIRTLYPDTNDYFYRYGDGYMYRVDRSSSLIDALLPLAFGGYAPGTMFPSAYSPYYSAGSTFPNYFGSSYVPDYYGWNSFYPDTPYMDYRYLNGNVYGVDPLSGMVENVIPTYAYGYGVGQMLPAGYGYYNVPNQYRSLYYDTSDYNYWYAPGAIYQVDPSSQLITSVASLLAPGLSIGQPLPMGYSTYNVPMAYRATYYDTPNAWYRYNNGYIYQVDPTTQLVTAIVASLLS
jgi:hypothetical protein